MSFTDAFFLWSSKLANIGTALAEYMFKGIAFAYVTKKHLPRLKKQVSHYRLNKKNILKEKRGIKYEKHNQKH